MENSLMSRNNTGPIHNEPKQTARRALHYFVKTSEINEPIPFGVFKGCKIQCEQCLQSIVEIVKKKHEVDNNRKPRSKAPRLAFLIDEFDQRKNKRKSKMLFEAYDLANDERLLSQCQHRYFVDAILLGVKNLMNEY